MNDHKFTDEEVIRALECCRTIDGNDCSTCPYGGKHYEIGSGGCSNHLVNDALDLIKRQKEEIEVIKETTAEIRYEAVKEFAEKLKTYYRFLNGRTSAGLVEYHIDQILNEMIGET